MLATLILLRNAGQMACVARVAAPIASIRFHRASGIGNAQIAVMAALIAFLTLLGRSLKTQKLIFANGSASFI